MSGKHLAPERLAEIRNMVPASPRIGDALDDVLAELDAVTRELDQAREALAGTVDFSAVEAGKYLDAAQAGIDYGKRHAMYPEHPDLATAHYALNRLCLIFAHMQRDREQADRAAGVLSTEMTAFHKRLELALGLDSDSSFAPDVWGNLAEVVKDSARLEYLRQNGYINAGGYTTSMLQRHVESLEAFRAAIDDARQSCGECDEGWRGNLVMGTLRRCENGCHAASDSAASNEGDAGGQP